MRVGQAECGAADVAGKGSMLAVQSGAGAQAAASLLARSRSSLVARPSILEPRASPVLLAHHHSRTHKHSRQGPLRPHPSTTACRLPSHMRISACGLPADQIPAPMIPAVRSCTSSHTFSPPPILLPSVSTLQVVNTPCDYIPPEPQRALTLVHPAQQPTSRPRPDLHIILTTIPNVVARPLTKPRPAPPTRLVQQPTPGLLRQPSLAHLLSPLHVTPSGAALLTNTFSTASSLSRRAAQQNRTSRTKSAIPH